MRIGEFAKKHDTTIDTVRHYMALELVIPDRRGGHYTFNDACSRDMEEVLHLREIGFTLQEIRNLFAVTRLTNLRAEEDRAYYRQLFTDKRLELFEERDRINAGISEIDKKLRAAENTEFKTDGTKTSLGVPIGFLHLMACPECKHSLSLNRGTIQNNMVLSGELTCRCGFTAAIDDGIVFMPEAGQALKHLDASTQEYFRKTAVEFVNLMYKGVEWLAGKLRSLPLENTVILEPGTGWGILLGHIIGFLPETCCYIAVDCSPSALRFTKNYLESRNTSANYIFLCSDLGGLPLKNESVDIVTDYLGSSNYNFSNPGFLVHLLEDLVKHRGKWLASHFYFGRGAKSLRKYPEELRKYFELSYITGGYQESKFRMLDSRELGCSEKAGEYEPFFTEGDIVFQWVYFGERT